MRRHDRRLELTGEIDRDNASTIAACLIAEVRTGANQLDLSRVTFIGAIGARAIVHARAALPDDSSLRVWCSPIVYQVLTLCKLNDIPGLTIAKTRHVD